MEVLSPRPTGEGQKTLFVTFYSFKGGVGRTLALLNVACILAGLGRRVLMIDFDLEAPGLTHFQDKQIEAGVSRQQPGLVDALDAFLDDPQSSPLGEEEPSIFFDRYVSSLQIPEGVQKGEKEGTLDLVPAGRLDADYEGRMYDLNFEEMFEEGVGRPLFERLKDLIEDSGRYDYILVDSRTGFSDEGSICTRFLGDHLLVLTGLNHQNVRGTARFLRQSNVAKRDETLALVASPVPMYYEDLRAERIEEAKEHIADRADLDEVRFVTQIPYHPVLALEEDPTVRSLEGTDLFESYEEITDRLRTWAGDLPEEQIERIPNLIRNGDTDEALAVFRDVRREDPEVALQFLRRTSQFLRESHPESSIDLINEGIDIAKEVNDLQAESSLRNALGNTLAEQDEDEQSIQQYERALNINRRLEDILGEATNLFNLGNMHSKHGRNKFAVQNYKDAIELFDEIDRTSGKRATLINLGNQYSERGEVERAIEYYEQARDLAQETGEQSNEAGAITNLGNQYADRGEVDTATELHEKACDLFQEAGDRSGLAFALANLAECYARSSRSDEALAAVNRAEELAEDLGDSSHRAAIHLDRALTLSYLDSPQALEILRSTWTLIQKQTDAFEKMRAHVLRARLRLEVEDNAEGATEDAQKALDFYRERDVDSRWSRKAEEILEQAQAHEE